jgi:dihydrolipoamide dehydrogenase
MHHFSSSDKMITMNRLEVDLAVIGAGPGGYVAAIHAAQMGKKVALIEKKDMGGTCLNVGCIPTKTLLSGSSLLKKIKEAKEFGIHVENIKTDYSVMKKRKDRIVTGIRNSLTSLLKTNKISIINGYASFESPTLLKVEGENSQFIQAEKIIIATGSVPVDIESFACDHERILNSTSILEIETLPKSLVIVGGGYIGCEFASLFAELGVKVTILEALHSIIPLLGESVSSALTKEFQRQEIEMKMNVFVKSIVNHKDHVTVTLGGNETMDFDMALISVGRAPASKGLKLEKAGIATDQKGWITVNEKMQTNVKGVYAIGDITGKWMLAHVASHQAIVAAKNAFGGDEKMHYHAVPAVVFTSPEIATVGYTLEEALEKGYDATVGFFPFNVLGKSIASGETEGFVQFVTEKKTERILGAQAVGHDASNLIAEATLAIQNELTLSCVTDTIHAHPTIAEAWLEAALIASETPIHFPPKKK